MRAAEAKIAALRLDPECQLLTNILKTVAYLVESDLANRLVPALQRAEGEGRTLIRGQGPALRDPPQDHRRRLVYDVADPDDPGQRTDLTAVCQETWSNDAWLRLPIGDSASAPDRVLGVSSRVEAKATLSVR